MKKMTTDEIHNELFILLKDLSSLLSSKNIKFFVFFGTLLGCIRHHGFIPWDDDIDIVVMPDDWDRMNKVITENLNPDKYSIVNRDANQNSPIWPYCTEVFVKGTYRKMEYFQDEIKWECGVVLDIFPFVKAPDNIFARKMWYEVIGIIDDIINMKSYKCGTFPSPRFLSTLLAETLCKKLTIGDICCIRKNLQDKYRNGTGNFLVVPFGPRGRYPLVKTLYRAEWMKTTVETEFGLYVKGKQIDVIKLPMPSDYLQILNTTYGEWMRKPCGRKSKGLSFYVNQNVC